MILRAFMLLCFILRSIIDAATINAASASSADVITAIAAASAGDTVVVPAGSATWSAASPEITTAITLQGAGIDQTIITVSGQSLDVKNQSATGIATVQGFTFQSATSASFGIIQFYGLGSRQLTENFRLTNCKIKVNPTSVTSSYRGIGTYDAYGLIDHCTFINTSSNGQGISVDTGGAQASIVNWHTPQSLGDRNTVVIEDNTFTFSELADGCLDSYPGCKFVFRHNAVTGTNIGWHGRDSSTRSCRLFEIYQNTFANSGSSIYVTIRARGGTGVVWGNTITGNYNGFFMLSHFRADPAYGDDPGAAYDGGFDSTYPGMGYPTGYPLCDQVGRGSFPGLTPGGWPSSYPYTTAEYEELDPLYVWSNSFLGNTSPTCDVSNPPESATYIVQGRDYYDNTAKVGYTQLIYPHPLQGAGGGGAAAGGIGGTATVGGKATRL